MDKPKRIIYKVKYEIEFEITKEVNDQGKFANPTTELTTNLVDKKIIAHNFDDIDHVVYGLLDACSYLEAHLPNEIAQLHNSLAMESTFLFEPQNREIRNVFIAEVLKITEARLRKRIAAKSGRHPDKTKIDYTQKEFRFISECEKILKTLHREGVKINKTVLAERMFTTYKDAQGIEQYYSNPLRELKKKLDLYETSFDELKANFTKNVT